MSRHRGVMLLELLAASLASTVVGGVIFLLMVGARDVWRTKITFNELSSSLDVAAEVLRKDIWGATGAATGVIGVCPASAPSWLTLTGATTITYCLDTSTPTNVKLRRVPATGAAWNVAQYILTGADTSIDLTNQPLIRIKLKVQKTVSGRQYPRQMTVFYRRQLP